MKIYQTVEDRGKPEDIRKYAPYRCKHETAWLGKGYYFWDYFIDLAHQWGKNGYNNNYVICSYDIDRNNDLWDLHSNYKHIEELQELCDIIIEKKLATKETILLSHVIGFLRTSNSMSYRAVRAWPPNSLSINNSNFITKIKFKDGHLSTLNLFPEIQICLFDKDALSLRNKAIVYPEHYVEQLYA